MGHKEGKINIPDLELSFSAVLYVEVEKKFCQIVGFSIL